MFLRVKGFMVSFKTHINYCLISLSLYIGIIWSSSMESSYVVSYSVWSKECFSFDFSIMLDFMSLVFMFTVLLIGWNVLIYCKWYMSSEVYYKRFVLLVCAFLMAMMFMIFTPNIFSLILGWDGLGLTSFILVCYYQNTKSLSAGMLTALTNRVGDVFMLLSISFMLSEGSWYLYNFCCWHNTVFLSWFLLVSGMTKSAQFPFCAWLPAAMAAPTPVSALVHSSTLVTAGVYLLIRSYFIISINSLSLAVLQSLSVLTLLLAGSSAFVCTDIKKTVALSTLSQLSMMMFSISINMPYLAFFHLITHAMFKALLFLSVGSVIHTNSGVQDLRALGGCWHYLPKSMAAMLVANCSLCGLPFLSGFFSKDLIVDMSHSSSMTATMYYTFMLGVSFTSLYSMRMSWVVMFGANKGDLKSVAYEEPFTMWVPYLSLSCGSILMGYILSNKMEALLQFSASSDEEVVVVVFMFFMSFLFFILFNRRVKIPKLWVRFLNKMWFTEVVSAQPASKALLMTSAKMNKTLEKGWLEYCGPQGVYRVLSKVSKQNEAWQSRYFFSSILIFSFLFFVVLFIIFIF